MDEFLERINRLSPKRLALLALEQHDQLDATIRRDMSRLPSSELAIAFLAALAIRKVSGTYW